MARTNILLQSPPSPTKFSAQATDSPSKLGVPSRRQRNQPANRVDDIEFVTQISTSLLSQVRQLQSVLAERDEALRTAISEKSRLEVETEGLTQRLKTLDESEQRYKDENWNLETQTHELLATAKENASKEQRLQQALAVLTTEKNAAQRELDDVKQAHGKLHDDYHSFRKAHDSEASTFRKNALGIETEREALQRKLDELTSQNQELARAVAGKFRGEVEHAPGESGTEAEEPSLDRSDTDHSPPPSPSKGAVRNTMLESETLKSSLHHAHRMIQNLKSNIHREKTEKLELKRMLQESRDELENRRSENGLGSASKRPKVKAQPDSGKKAPKFTQLGAGRRSRVDVEIETAEWEDQDGEGTRRNEPPAQDARISASQPEGSDVYQTATEAEDSFETANERDTGTETEAFQTGNESLGGDSSGDLTETESAAVRTGAVRTKKAVPVSVSAKRSSFISTASASDDEHLQEARTPVQQPTKYRVRLGKGSRRSRVGSEEPGKSPASTNDSPASHMSTREAKGQSLFAELGDLEGKSDNESDEDAVRTRDVSLDPGTPDRSFHGLADPLDAANNGVLANSQGSRFTEPLHTYPPVEGVAETKLPGLQETKFSRSSGTQIEAHDGGPADRSIKRAQLSFSAISSLETVPFPYANSARAPDLTASRPPTAIYEDPSAETSNSKDAQDSVSAGVLGSVIGWAIGKKSLNPETDETKKAEQQRTATGTSSNGALKEILPSLSQKGMTADAPVGSPSAISKNDQGSQTTLSALQIDSLLSAKDAAATAITPLSIAQPQNKSELPSPTKSPSQSSLSLGKEVALTPRSVKRLGSVASVRQSNSNVPPLPADHRQAIAAAQQAPSKEKQELRIDSNMGPPALPASAYRSPTKRPQTPNDQASQTPTSATPRARHSTARSSRSRRSSVSSFESELDARFNIRADGLPVPQGFDSSTDPRMIQAITQTMIGEYLWKYTRKAGRGEMSDKRHRRFFWVHPYTRTLYWSDQDPSTAGRVQLKAKSVAIEAVRVVVDDNPMPPGLHRKSLIVITPGRDVKFTATTGQRHETWFNALSYLLLRSNADLSAEQSQITAEDVAEFNPGFGRRAGSRVSLSSYNSRTNTTRQSLMSNRAPSPSKNSVRRIPPTPHATSSSRMSQPNNSSIGSRFSSYWRPSRYSSMNNRAGPPASSGSIYDASVVNDSAEDVRQVLAREEQEADKLENVRACCDGL